MQIPNQTIYSLLKINNLYTCDLISPQYICHSLAHKYQLHSILNFKRTIHFHDNYIYFPLFLRQTGNYLRFFR